MKFADDVIIYFRNGKKYISNTRVHNNFFIENKTLLLLEHFLETGVINDNNDWYIENLTIFSQIFSLMGDPTRVIDEDISNYNINNSSNYAFCENKGSISSNKKKIYNSAEDIIKLLTDNRILILDNES